MTRAVVALDLAAHSEEVLDRAVAWASRFGMTLDLRTVHGLPLPLEPLAATGQFPSLTAEWTSLHEIAHAKLSALAARVPEPTRGDWHVLVGSAAEQLVRASERADLLILGVRSHGSAAHLFLGAVAEWVVRRSACPVLVLHRDDDRATDPASPVRCVVPVDPTAPSPRGLEVVRKWMGTAFQPHLVAVTEPHEPHGEAWAALRFVARANGLPPETHLDVVERGAVQVGDRIASVARELGAGLVALPTHQRRGADRFLVGSVAERVARTAHCPVLTVGPG